jgi:hypothetical protein
MQVQLPNASLFPEIDFASKCVEQSDGSGPSSLLFPLSNSNSSEIRQRIRDARFFVGVQQIDNSDVGHVEINTNGQLGDLVRGQVYT